MAGLIVTTSPSHPTVAWLRGRSNRQMQILTNPVERVQRQSALASHETAEGGLSHTGFLCDPVAADCAPFDCTTDLIGQRRLSAGHECGLYTCLRFHQVPPLNPIAPSSCFPISPAEDILPSPTLGVHQHAITHALPAAQALALCRPCDSHTMS